MDFSEGLGDSSDEDSGCFLTGKRRMGTQPRRSLSFDAEEGQKATSRSVASVTNETDTDLIRMSKAQTQSEADDDFSANKKTRSSFYAEVPRMVNLESKSGPLQHENLSLNSL